MLKNCFLPLDQFKNIKCPEYILMYKTNNILIKIILNTTTFNSYVIFVTIITVTGKMPGEDALEVSHPWFGYEGSAEKHIIIYISVYYNEYHFMKC
jgi:hypothetical protein